jgi:hypothetical protein
MQSGCHDRSRGESDIGGALMRNPLRLSTNPLTTAFAAAVFVLVACAARAETVLHSNSKLSNSEPAFTSSFDERFWPPQSSEGGRPSTTSNDEHDVQRQGNSFLTSSDDEHHRQTKQSFSSPTSSDDEHHRQTKESFSSLSSSDDEHHQQTKQSFSSLTSSDDEHHRQRNENSALTIFDDEHRQEGHRKELALLTSGPSKRGESPEFKFDRDDHLASSVSPHCR